MKDISLGLKRKATFAAVFSAVFFTGIAIGYGCFGKIERFYEMTFLSNAFAAIVLLSGAVRISFFGKDIAHFLYLCAATLLAVVVGICLFFAPGATFLSPSVMLHLVNPILMFAFYVSFCDARAVGNGIVFSTLVIPFAYYVFMIVFGRVTGGAIYTYFDPNSFGVVLLVVFAVVAGAATLGAARLLMMFSRRLHNKRESKLSEVDKLASEHTAAID